MTPTCCFHIPPTVTLQIGTLFRFHMFRVAWSTSHPQREVHKSKWHVGCCRGAASFGAAWTRVSGLKQNVVSQIAIAILQFKAMSGWSDDEDDIPCPSSGVSRACCDPFVFVVIMC